MKKCKLFIRWSCSFCFVFFQSLLLFGQSEIEITDLIQQVLENYTEDNDDEIDVESLIQNLTVYYRNPINLNEADFTELSELQLLTPPQIDALLNHRKKSGDLLNIYELQSIKYFDLNTIERLLPFIEVKGEIDDVNIRLGKLFSEGKHSLFMRYEQTLEDRSGYLNGNYLGGPQKLYTRYQYQYGQNLSFGFTAEKDAGEPFGGTYNPAGFDFYSFHVYLKDYGPFKYLALGDYRLNFGQGLAMWSGFSARKSDLVLSTLKNAYLTKRFTSVTEFEFSRGAAATIELGDLDLTAFASHKPIDANIQLLDTLNNEVLEVGAFQISGLHRTENEIEDKHSIQETLLGGNVTFERKNIEFGASAIYSKYSSPLSRDLALYSQFQFNHNELLNASVNYRLLFNNFHFFGEWATSNDLIGDNANKLGFATVNGVLVSIDPKVSFTLLHRHYNVYYEARYAKAFAESNRANNESGLYFGTSIKPHTRWQIDAYADFYKHSWLRFLIDAPSNGFDYRVLLTYKPSRKVNIKLRYINEIKQRNLGENLGRTDYLVKEDKSAFRATVTYKLTKALRFKTRIETTTYQEAERPRETGFLVFQDINIQPVESQIAFNARFSLFDTDSYNTRIYVYENSPLYAYANRNFSGTGYRYYFNIKYEPLRMLDLWAKIERTKYLNTNYLVQFDGISSGNQFINDDKITTITVQARLKF